MVEQDCNLSFKDLLVDDSSCAFPKTIKLKSGRITKVACGKCYRCLKKRKMAFTNRLYYEHLSAKQTWWITFTYNEENVPTLEVNELSDFDEPFVKTYKVLNYDDVQKFMKSIRKALWNVYRCKLRYFLVGEYGPTTFRPHYHCLLFFDTQVPSDFLIKLLDYHWANKYGFYMLDTATEERFQYCAKYCIRPTEENEVFKFRPPFMRCSKGIGKQFITDAKKKYYQDLITQPQTIRNASFLVRDSFRFALPRYYKDRLFTQQQKRQIAYYNQVRSKQLDEQKTLLINKLYQDYDDAAKQGDQARMEDCSQNIRLYHEASASIVRNREEQHKRWYDKQLKKAKI